jgi:outer membrane protein assembly factor BamB
LLPLPAAEPSPTAADEQLLKNSKIGTDGAALLEFFRQRTEQTALKDRIAKLIRQLGDDSYDVREKASSDLAQIGEPARKQLEKALTDKDPEIARRAEECLQREPGVGAGLAMAAARLLAQRKPDGAVKVLLDYLPSAEDESVAEEVRSALAALALKDGKIDPLIFEALVDKNAAKRAAAGVVLARSGGEEHRAAVRKMLEDADPNVRLHVGLTLVSQKEKDAIPVLIDLLAKLPQEEIWPIEDILYRLAQDKAPTVDSGPDGESAKSYRDAWAKWWQANEDKIDLAKIDLNAAQLGYTLLILLDANRVMEIDKDKKVRWKIDNLQFPLDAQMLPGEHVLIAEHNGNIVTERSREGKVLWKKEIAEPLMAQRLRNGHTFIGTRSQLVEVDRDGKEVFTYSRPDGDAIMKAVKLPNGDMAAITDAGVFVRLNSAGKEIKSYPASLQYYGGRLEVLPNGHLLLPRTQSNDVIELDTEGKPTKFRAQFNAPIAAARLPNGNTLITSMNQQKTLEVDKAGAKVWEYSTDTRVTRSFRR